MLFSAPNIRNGPTKRAQLTMANSKSPTKAAIDETTRKPAFKVGKVSVLTKRNSEPTVALSTLSPHPTKETFVDRPALEDLFVKKVWMKDSQPIKVQHK